jgi:hypothetical protein
MMISNKTLNFPLARSSFYKLGDFLNMIQVDINQVIIIIIIISFFLIKCIIFNEFSKICGFFQYYILIFITPILLIAAVSYSFLIFGLLFLIPALGSVAQVIFGVILGAIYGGLQRKFMHG